MSGPVHQPLRQIVALGGGGFSMEPDNPALDDCILELSGRDSPRICFIPTASGDAQIYIERFYQAFSAGRAVPSHLSLFERDDRDLREFLLAQNVIYVGGGSVANLISIWRLHGVDDILRQCWHRGIILCGISAGMNCWFQASVTDSFGPIAAFNDGMGLLPGSACPHYDGEADRRPCYHRLVLNGELPAGYAADDGAALHFVGTTLKRVVTSRPNARAYRVEVHDGAVRELELPVTFLASRAATREPST
jgi:dipeptidase E